MRLLSFAEFAALPSGVLFRVVESNNILEDEVRIKRETLSQGDGQPPRDFIEESFLEVQHGGSDELDANYERMAADSSLSLPVEPHTRRDGVFDLTRRFLVYEPADVQAIIAKLTALIA